MHILGHGLIITASLPFAPHQEFFLRPTNFSGFLEKAMVFQCEALLQVSTVWTPSYCPLTASCISSQTLMPSQVRHHNQEAFSRQSWVWILWLFTLMVTLSSIKVFCTDCPLVGSLTRKQPPQDPSSNPICISRI